MHSRNKTSGKRKDCKEKFINLNSKLKYNSGIFDIIMTSVSFVMSRQKNANLFSKEIYIKKKDLSHSKQAESNYARTKGDLFRSSSWLELNLTQIRGFIEPARFVINLPRTKQGHGCHLCTS